MQMTQEATDMMNEEAFAAHQERMQERASVERELAACLAEIRALQRRRIAFERRLRQLHREGYEQFAAVTVTWR
jgi:hypothetical protein